MSATEHRSVLVRCVVAFAIGFVIILALGLARVATTTDCQIDYMRNNHGGSKTIGSEACGHFDVTQDTYDRVEMGERYDIEHRWAPVFPTFRTATTVVESTP